MMGVDGVRVHRDDASEGSEDTFSTLMSNASDDKDFDWNCEEYKKLDERGRLEFFFKVRERLLNDILDERSSDLAGLLRDNEEAVKLASFKLLEGDRKEQTDDADADADTDKNENTSSPPKTITITTKVTRPSKQIFLRRLILFEIHHSFPGFVAMIVYSLLHLSAYEVVFTAICELTKTWLVTETDYDIFYLILLIVCCVSCRLCGGVWEWVSVDRYRAVKFDFHNRMRLGYWDARVHAWFRKHNIIKTCVYSLSFYLILIAMYHFETRLLGLMDRRDFIVSNLPSKDYNVTTLVRRILNGSLVGIPESSCEETCSPEEMAEMLDYEDDVYLYSTLSLSSFLSIRGDEKSPVLLPIVANTFHTTVAACSIFFLTWLGCGV